MTHIEWAGLDHVLVGDHVSHLGGRGADGLIQAASLLTACDLPVHVGVYLLPLRHPVLVARQISDLAMLAPGRLVLGVGVGGEDRHEYEVCGVDPATRGQRCDQALTVLRELLTGQPVDRVGGFFPLEQATVLPPPAQAVPILVGGRSDAAVLRTARLGDGWSGVWVSPRRWAQVLAQVDEEAGRAGRSDVQWQHEMQMSVGFGDTPEKARAALAQDMLTAYRMPFESFERYSPYGSVADVAAFLASYVEAGCTSFSLLPVGVPDGEAALRVAEVRKLLQ